MNTSNQKIADFFESAIKNQNLAQAYCFSGVRFLGKENLAKDVAAKLLKTTPDKLELQPDFCLLERGFDEKTEKPKKEIAVAQVRALRGQLQNYSWSNGYKIVLVRDAELLNAEASNAFLKILEEPKGKTIFFLLTQNDELLLPTIKSRLQTFYFVPAADTEIKDFLKNAGVGESKIEKICLWAAGRIELAKKLLDNDFFEEYESLWSWWQTLRASTLGKRLEMISKVLDEKKSEGSLEELLAEIDVWITAERAEIFKSNLSEEEKNNQLKALSELLKLKNILPQNVNPRLALETVCLNF